MDLKRITVDPTVMSGKPCIRGLEVTVAEVLRQLANHRTPTEILETYPDLKAADIDACLAYAAMRVNELAPAPDNNGAKFRSYDDVPYYRKQWFFWLSWVICAPVALIILFSGDVYYRKNGTVVSFGTANKVVGALLCLFWIFGALTNAQEARQAPPRKAPPATWADH